MSNKYGLFNTMTDLCGPPKQSLIKIALIGDGSTGKTSYFERILSGDNSDYKFNKHYDATKGCNICQIEFIIGKYPITVHLFDTAGQEKFGALRDSYLVGIDGVILMYDITDRTTKQNALTKWIPEVKNILIASRTNKYVPIMVVGNKSDKIDSIDTMTTHLRISTLLGCYESKFGEIDHCYISVKADENLMKPINWLLKYILSYYFNINVKKTNKQTQVTYCN